MTAKTLIILAALVLTPAAVYPHDDAHQGMMLGMMHGMAAGGHAGDGGHEQGSGNAGMVGTVSVK